MSQDTTENSPWRNVKFVLFTCYSHEQFSTFYHVCSRRFDLALVLCVLRTKVVLQPPNKPPFFIEVSILTAVFISAMGAKRCSYKVVCASEICWMLLQAIHKETQQQGRFHVGVRARWEEPLQTHGGFSPTTKPRRSNLWHSNMSDTCTHHLGSHPDNLTDATREEILSEEDQKDSRASLQFAVFHILRKKNQERDKTECPVLILGAFLLLSLETSLQYLYLQGGNTSFKDENQ